VTRYTVAWHNDALDELTSLWMASTDRRSIAAADAIDSELAQDAGLAGVTVGDDLRELLLPPLRVLFSVSEPDRLVKVMTIALT
jgi:hypothetical protein